MSDFRIGEQFLLNGVPFQIISGALHYFRVPRAYWRDRLQKLRAMGCNTVETYIPWNLHEPKPNEFYFSDALDVAAFLKLAQELGLYALVRPSPFICAEWEFGGLPAWLLADEDFPLRSSDGAFLDRITPYYERLFRELVPLQITHGGPILMMQVENEYGAWVREDKPYLRRMRDLMRQFGAEVPLFTADDFEHMQQGCIEDTLTTINLGSHVAQRLPLLDAYTQGKPKMVGEFWIGWFDAWSEPHHTNPAQSNADELAEILSRGASVNIYMLHGGTNPGFMNGSNDYGSLAPDTTSYDYDAPLAEDGSVTPKYRLLQKTIARFAQFDDTLPPPLPHAAFGRFTPDGQVALHNALSMLGEPVALQTPCSMERLGQSYGYTLYCATLPPRCHVTSLRFTRCTDRAQLFADGVPVKTLYDRELESEIPLDLETGTATQLSVLTENLGRVNYGAAMEHQRKGIDGAVTVNGQPLDNWQAYTLALEGEQLSRLSFGAVQPSKQPCFYRFTVSVGTPCDTFLFLPGWGKGCVFLNGVNLGRFWEVGPQQHLFVPAPYLKSGENELIVFETEGKRGKSIEFQ